ncbi:dehydrogenase [Desulfoluna limicola]|uniref:Dehydrogenase n=1 Tax=Desulfoluna limicola TaxID=2810562 RepID=A0ABN6F9J4_9BACT|nr:MaoC family dehydratase [Desulfoluna limicola]BCS98535.1 dehydrogenase [Desulfoluna limicola]
MTTHFTQGTWAEFTKTITEADIYGYAGITGDFNPVHINETYARATAFKGRIAHGMLTAGLISNVIGTRLPGPGTIYLSQELTFTAPVRANDTITARVEVMEPPSAKGHYRLNTTCTNQEGLLVLGGSARVAWKG